jgi:single-strand DNA-binding protein
MARRKSTTAPAEQQEASASEQATASQEADITLKGHLVNDPVLRKTNSGIPVTTIRIGVKRVDGETTYHSVVCWKRTAEVVAQFKRKGHEVEVTGRPVERTWTDKDGNDRTSVEISAYSVQFVRKAEQAAEPELAA